jgi:phosphotriesterase-related protein
MKRERRLENIMLSHDGNTFPYGGKASRLYETLFRELIPAMRKDGFTEPEIQRLTVENPRLVLTFGVRRNTA